MKNEMPKLKLLVGVPGSGKTTYANEYIKDFPNTVHLSSDLIRKELYGDESIQGNPSEVFGLMQKRAIDALNDGLSVIYDATNITRKDRGSIISICPKFVQIEAVIVWAPIEICLERDKNRNKTVGEEVINRMLRKFQAPFYDEGIDDIRVQYPDDFDCHKYGDEMWEKLKISHDNHHHTLTILEHCKKSFINMEEKTNDKLLHLSALYHDFGKPYVKSFTDSKGNPCNEAHYYNHQCLGAWVSYGLPYSTPKLAWLVSVHMDPYFNTKYYQKLLPTLKKEVDLLHESDVEAH